MSMALDGGLFSVPDLHMQVCLTGGYLLLLLATVARLAVEHRCKNKEEDFIH